jgi:hypothetical protein
MKLTAMPKQWRAEEWSRSRQEGIQEVITTPGNVLNPASVHLTPSESDLLVSVATARNRRLSLTNNPPATRAVNGLAAKGMVSKIGDEIEITPLGQQRCTSIY